MKKSLRYSLLVLLCILTLLLCGGYYLIGYALQPAELESRSRDLQGSTTYVLETYPEIQPWLDSLVQHNALREAWIQNERQENLHALFVEAAEPTDRTAVILHGYTDNAVRMLMIGYLYNKVLGYNILLPDLHAHGASEGRAIQMGWLDRPDVLQWMIYADEIFGRNKGYETTRMVVHGISMGAATTMMVAGEVNQGANQMPFVRCFVEDCGYTCVWDEFRSELKTQFSLPAFPLLHIASLLTRFEYGWDFREASALHQVSQCRLPMLFIHGDADTFVPTWMVHPLYEAKPQPKELWLVPGCDHAHAYRDHKAEYTTRIKNFVEKYVP